MAALPLNGDRLEYTQFLCTQQFDLSRGVEPAFNTFHDAWSEATRFLVPIGHDIQSINLDLVHVGLKQESIRVLVTTI